MVERDCSEFDWSPSARSDQTGWTEPYFGVQHRMRGRTQTTVAVYSTFTNACVFPWLGEYVCLRPSHEQDFTGPDHAQRARAWLDSLEVSRG